MYAMTKILQYKVIMSTLEIDSVLVQNKQYGFRFSRSTAEVLIFISAFSYLPLDKNSETRVVALDILKVFDRVWYNDLLLKPKVFKEKIDR